MVRKLVVSLLIAGMAVVPAWAAKGVRGKAAKGKPATVDASGGQGVNLPARDVWASLTEGERAAVLDMIVKSSPLKDNLNKNRYRVFSIEATPVKTATGLQRQAYTLMYDYVSNKMYQVINNITSGAPGNIIETNILPMQPPPTAEEYAEARALVMSLDRVQQLLRGPNVILQDGFTVGSEVPACAENRCVQIQVNETPEGRNGKFLLLVTVDLSARRIAEVREPKTPTTLAR